MTEESEAGLGLVVENLVTGYGSIEVLHGVSINVEPGSAVAIVGSNGAGKSTLLRAVSGLLPVLAGSITLGSHDVSSLSPHKIARAGVGHIPEGRQVLQRLTVRENLILGAQGSADAPERLDALLETFPALRDKLGQVGGQLSGGQQQMLAIARALMANPRLILLDEPTVGLSPKLTDELYYLLARIRREWKATFVLVEQNIALAADLTDQAILLQRGRVIRTEPSKSLMHDEDLLKAYLT